MNKVELTDYIKNILGDSAKIDLSNLKRLIKKLETEDTITLNNMNYKFYLDKDTSIFNIKEENKFY